MSLAKQKNCSSCGVTLLVAPREVTGNAVRGFAPSSLTAIGAATVFALNCLSDAKHSVGLRQWETSLDSCCGSVAEPVVAGTEPDLGSPSLLVEGEDYYSERG